MSFRGNVIILLAALHVGGCAGLFEEPEPVPTLNYAALSCEQLAIELALNVEQQTMSQRLLIFNESIPGGDPGPHRRSIAQARLNIETILRERPRCALLR